LVDTIRINAGVLYRYVSAKAGASAINLNALRIEFAKPGQVRSTVCTDADFGVLKQLKEQQRYSVSSLTTRYIETQPVILPSWKDQRKTWKQPDDMQYTHRFVLKM
jgi:hypothetical protein